MVSDTVYNQIYDDTIIKYTLNIPLDLYKKITNKTRRGTRYNGRRSTFIREVLEKAIINERPVSMAEFRRLEHGEVTEPPKRFSGFIDSLLRNSFMWAWWQRKYLTKG